MIERLKQNKLILIIFMISIILIITGVTYSLYEILFTGRKEQVIDAGGIVFKYNETSDGLILDNNSILNDTDGKSQEKYFDFEISLASNKNTSINYIIAIDENDVSTLTNDKVKVYLTNQDNIEIVSPISISQLEVDVNKNNYKKLYNKQINQGEKHLYRLRTWIDDTKDLYTETSNDGNHTLEMKDVIYKFKVNVYTVLENEETIITGVDTLIKLTDNKDNSGLYTITHPADSTLQIGNDKDIIEYRYRGASPKNYVTFNGETWRIIGVFPTDDGTGKIENRIKLIRNESIGKKYWDISGSNNWARPATLNTELNTTYLNNLSPTAQSMIGNTKYYLGGYKDTTITSEVMYQNERKINGSTYYNGSNPNNFIGKLGLMYASDYGYAVSDECSQNLSSYNNTTCKNNNWLFKGNTEWLLPQIAVYNENTFYVLLGGDVKYGYNVSNNQFDTRPVLYLKPDVKIIVGHGTSTDPYVIGINQKDTSGASAPVLASNMVPVYYDDSKNVWKCADKENKDSLTRWYHYDYKMWANAVTINYSDSSIKNRYFNSDGTLKIKPGEEVLMADITTMWVWIPRFNAVTPSNYNGGTQAKPNAIDVTFVKQNETAIDAFTFGTKELSGFWYGKFETSHTTLASSTTANNLGCSNETCNNANGIIIKPNVKSLHYNNVSNHFFASRSMEQTGNSFGFVSTEVDTHMSKNNEWGAVAYLTQSIYGRCTNSTTCTEVGINNSMDNNYKSTTGYGAPAGSDDNALNGAYNTPRGKDASTTGTIYGIYDMSGGAYEYVMGVSADTNGKPRSGKDSSSNSGFTGMLSDGTTYTGVPFPDSKYYNLYTGSSYIGHALTETKNWYSDDASFVSSSHPWFIRGGYSSFNTSAGVFYFHYNNGNSSGDSSSRLVISNE